ncbi:MAG: universal stress protein [Chloroflexi bacterium]|nr:universal stress protein [Chloroflexota bacterium]MCI0581233.1 universal stress protein [Chloroflexota bacterium]MCI0646910.1 universal stress protein [Chloroflexota bacterium]MCI0731639.1 universal stress protein [Chloroflexota bacterium]
MFEKILVPLDGSELSESALPPALAIARPVKGTVILLRVPVYEKVLLPAPEGMGLLLPDQSMNLARHQAREYLEGIRQTNAHPDVVLRTRVVEGDEASVIVDTAAQEAADLIVMSTHGRTGLRRWVYGSVCEKVMHNTAASMLIVRPPAYSLN